METSSVLQQFLAIFLPLVFLFFITMVAGRLCARLGKRAIGRVRYWHNHRAARRLCRACGRRHWVDLRVPDEIWFQIKPSSEAGGGTLCGRCLTDRLEALGRFEAFDLVEVR